MRSLPGRLAALVGVLLVCSCGSDRALSPTAPGQVTRQAASAARSTHTSAVVTLQHGSISVEGADIWIRHASNGSESAWVHGGSTDGRGKCTLSHLSGSGYYHIKATHPGGAILASWNSVPLNRNLETHLTLQVSGRRDAFSIPHPEVRFFSLPGGGEIEMVFVPSGTFRMGSDQDEHGRDLDEGPPTRVSLSDGFYVSRCEITQDQWMRVVGTAPWRSFRETAERFGLQGVTVAEDGAFFPAESVGWDGVQTFIQALNAHTGADLYRLPTEAEWEYAARAGSAERWSFGEREGALDQFGWTRKNTVERGVSHAQPVGTRRPNRWGLYDVYGNVAEWVQDWYRPYNGGHLTDPQGPLSGIHADRGYRSKKVIRGGSFVDAAPRSADRDFADTEGVGSRIGFRIVRAAVAPARELASRY